MKTKTFLGTFALLALFTFGASAQITVDNVLTNGLFEPYSVAVDADNLVYIADSSNHRIVRYDPNAGTSTTIAGTAGVSGGNDGPSYLAHFNSPQGIVLATVSGVSGLVVADTGNHTIRFVDLSNGNVSTLAGSAGIMGSPVNTTGANARFRFPIGLSMDSTGVLYIADSKNNVIRQISLSDPTFSVTTLAIANTTLYEPNAVAVVDPNQLWIADTRNHTVKLATRTSATTATITTLMGSNNQNVSGSTDHAFGGFARFNNPRGLLWLGAGGLVIADTGNQTIRLATNNPAFGFGATNYAVKTLAGIAGQSGLVNGPALSAKFAGPHGLARDVLGSGFLIADTANSVIRRIQTGPTQPPVSAPQIGWVDFQKDSFGDLVSVLRTDQPFVFNNDVVIAVLSEQGTETFYTFGPTPPSPVEDNIPAPNHTTGGTPPAYHDGMHVSEVPGTLVAAQPDLTVKLIGSQDGRQSSPIVQARFQFKTGNPSVVGENAASFTVSDNTIGAVMYYTTDGSDPTNGAPSLGPIANGTLLSFNIGNSNMLFKIRAFRNGFKNSEATTKLFAATNFVPNKITFGFESGEASSEFVASAGQIFYSPVTLATIPGATMYGLQFALTVTNVSGTAVAPGAVEFTSMLQQLATPQTGTKLPPGQIQWFRSIPPAMFVNYATNYDDTGTNAIGIVPVFQDLMFTNSTIGSSVLLGVGWLERWGFKNLYDTTVQDLISHSIARDTLFEKGDGRVVLGAYGFQVPLSANLGDVYQIDIDRPSANNDAVGAPSSDVFIDAPKSGSLASGTLNSRKNVTVGQRKYIVGDVAPFRWLNAGDFGNTNILNNDVMQVYETAVYNFERNDPPKGSDLFNSMDSCCATGFTNGSTVFAIGGTVNPTPFGIFNADDTSINDYSFGDGQVDVTDVFVTFRRSLDCSLTWWQRFHTPSGLAAETVANQYRNNTNCPPSSAPLPPPPPPAGPAPALKVLAGDGISAAGQTVLVPITAQIRGNYPLRVLAVGITVEPLDGAPAITTPIQFTPVAALGSPSIVSSRSANNYAAAWLNNAITGLAGDTQLGYLTVTLPANCTPTSAYAIHFDHASGSPNGYASFPTSAGIGLVTTTARSSSNYGDGIPDSWRLRYFGTVNNLLSRANADADGDGATNLQEYRAGTNPNDASSVLKAKSKKGAGFSIQWPSTLNKQYVVERANSIYSTTWSTISTNTGTGWDMEFQDNSPVTGARFYRVRVAD